jgi:hypothetical protein
LKLVDLMKVEGRKILRNVRISQISMLSRTKWVLSMYMRLVAKMAEDNISLMAAWVNFELFCDADLLISFSCLMLMLETIHTLIKFA